MENKNGKKEDQSSKRLDSYSNQIDNIDKRFEKLPPYKSGQKTGSFINKIIDVAVDFLIKKK